MSALALDGLLGTLTLVLGWAALAAPRARHGVILFMAFGLVLALVWVRLNAPDVALAEAAIGAGLTGALLLASLADHPGAERHPPRRPGLASALVTAGALALTGVMAAALTAALGQASRPDLREEVFGHLEVSGVSNPVTAVLLNFRAYDTLLELAVLLAALLGILALGPARPGYRAAGPVFEALSRWLVPLLILASAYLLWVGGHAPGGAFQAGALLGAAGVLLRLSGRPLGGLPGAAGRRLLAVAGAGVFLGVGLLALLAGRPFLGYPEAWAGTLILVIETAATLSIAATLVMAFIGGRFAAAAEGPGETGRGGA